VHQYQVIVKEDRSLQLLLKGVSFSPVRGEELKHVLQNFLRRDSGPLDLGGADLPHTTRQAGAGVAGKGGFARAGRKMPGKCQ